MTTELAIRVEMLLGATGPRPRLSGPLLVRTDRRPHGRLLLLVFEEGRPRPTWVVKMARSEASREGLRREWSIYSRLRERCPVLREGPPWRFHDAGEAVFLLEPFAAGGPAAGRSGPDALRRPLEWLARFQEEGAGAPRERRDLLALAADTARRARRAGAPAQLVEEMTARIEGLGPVAIRSVPVHGDFTPLNVLIDGDRVGVTDWERARPAGWPFEDLWTFLLLSARRRRGLRGPEEAAARALSGRHLVGPAAAFARRAGFPPALLPASALLVLLRSIAPEPDAAGDWRAERGQRFLEIARRLSARLPAFRAAWRGVEG